MDSPIQPERFKETIAPKRSLVFYFHDDGRLDITNALTGETVLLSELNRQSKDFYVQKRITFIKNRLIKSMESRA